MHPFKSFSQISKMLELVVFIVFFLKKTVAYGQLETMDGAN